MKEIIMNGKIVCDDNNLKMIINERYKQCKYVIDVSDLDTSKCTSFESLFRGFAKLRVIIGFNTLDTCNVKSMRGMCFSCYTLTGLNLSGLNLSNVKDIREMCSHCHALTSLNLSGLNLLNVKYASHLCFNCSSLQSLNLSGLDLSNVEDINEMTDLYFNCYALVLLIPPRAFPKDSKIKSQFESFKNEDADILKAFQQFNIQLPQPQQPKPVEHIQQPQSFEQPQPMPSLVERKNDIIRRQKELDAEKQRFQKDVEEEFIRQQEYMNQLASLKTTFI